MDTSGSARGRYKIEFHQSNHDLLVVFKDRLAERGHNFGIYPKKVVATDFDRTREAYRLTFLGDRAAHVKLARDMLTVLTPSCSPATCWDKVKRLQIMVEYAQDIEGGAVAYEKLRGNKDDSVLPGLN